MGLLQKSKPRTFGLQRRNKVFDDSDPVFKHPGYRFTSNKLDFIEGYRGSDLDIVVRLYASDESTNFDLLFSAIPTRGNEQSDEGTNPINITESRVDIQSDQTLMFIEIARLVKCPEGIIPSRVWSVPMKDRVNFFRNISTPSFDLSLKLIGTIGERESSGLGLSDPSSTKSKGISCAIEGGAQITNGIIDTITERVHWDRIKNLNFENLVLRYLRIRLEKTGLLVTTPELSKFPFKVISVFLCARNLSS